jgi:hypothetical protein
MGCQRLPLIGMISLLICLAVAPARAETPSLARDEVLRAEPLPTAAPVGTVPSGAPVDLKERKGFWQKVTAGNLTGWVKLSSLDLGDGEAAVSGLAALATGRGASGNVVAASGTRGLSAEDLSAAEPDEEELARLLAISVTPVAQAQFAAQGKLSPRVIPYIAPIR